MVKSWDPGAKRIDVVVVNNKACLRCDAKELTGDGWRWKFRAKVDGDRRMEDIDVSSTL